MDNDHLNWWEAGEHQKDRQNARTIYMKFLIEVLMTDRFYKIAQALTDDSGELTCPVSAHGSRYKYEGCRKCIALKLQEVAYWEFASGIDFAYDTMANPGIISHEQLAELQKKVFLLEQVADEVRAILWTCSCGPGPHLADCHEIQALRVAVAMLDNWIGTQNPS